MDEEMPIDLAADADLAAVGADRDAAEAHPAAVGAEVPEAAPAAPALQERTVAVPLQMRLASTAPLSADAVARTIEAVFTTGAQVRRVDWLSGEQFVEELDLAGMDLSRLEGAPVLDSHRAEDLDSVLGVVERAEVRDGAGVALLRFAETAGTEEIWQKVRQGIVRQVSVGYEVLRAEVGGAVDGLRRLIVRSWRPLEISMVAIGADAGARVRSADTAASAPCVLIEPAADSAPQAEPPAPPEPAQEAPAAPAEIVRRCIAAGQPELAPSLIEQRATATAVAQRLECTTEIRRLVELARRVNPRIDAGLAAGFAERGAAPGEVRAALFDQLVRDDVAHVNAVSPGAAATRFASAAPNPENIYAARAAASSTRKKA